MYVGWARSAKSMTVKWLVTNLLGTTGLNTQRCKGQSGGKAPESRVRAWIDQQPRRKYECYA